MTTELEYVVSESTKIVPVTFEDENGDNTTPVASSVTWTLYSETGDIINSREDEPETSAETVNIVLSGNDLKFSDGARRILVVKARYNSTLGDNLPLVNMASFSIRNLLAGRP